MYKSGHIRVSVHSTNGRMIKLIEDDTNKSANGALQFGNEWDDVYVFFDRDAADRIVTILNGWIGSRESN